MLLDTFQEKELMKYIYGLSSQVLLSPTARKNMRPGVRIFFFFQKMKSCEFLMIVPVAQRENDDAKTRTPKLDIAQSLV